MNKDMKKRFAVMLALLMVFTSAPIPSNRIGGVDVNLVRVAQAAVDANGVITGLNGTSEGSLSYGDKYKVTLTDGALTVTVGTKNWTFQNGAHAIGMCVVNRENDFLHFFSTGGKYYVLDLRNGTFICKEVYWSEEEEKYYSSENLAKDAVYVRGTSILDTKKYYRYLSISSSVPMKFVTRADWDAMDVPANHAVATPTPTPWINVTTPTPTQQVATPTPWINIPTPTPQVATPTPTAQAATPTPWYNATPTPTPKNTSPTPTPNVWGNGEIDTQSHTDITGTIDWTSNTKTVEQLWAEFYVWWEANKLGERVYEETTQKVAQNNWTVATQESGKDIEYYFYDDKGQLIKKEVVYGKRTDETGNGTGTEKSGTTGKEEYKEKETGNAGGNVKEVSQSESTTVGQAKVDLDVDTKEKTVFSFSVTDQRPASNGTVSTAAPAAAASNGKDGKDGKNAKVISYGVKRKGTKIKLTKTVNGKTGIVCTIDLSKKGVLTDANGLKVKKVKYAGYTSKSKQVILLLKNGKVKILPRSKSAHKTYTIRTIKGKWKDTVEDARGLVMRVTNGKNKVKGVGSLQPKKK